MNTVGKCLLGGGAIAGTVTLANNKKVRKAVTLGTIATGTAAGVVLAKPIGFSIKSAVNLIKRYGLKEAFKTIKGTVHFKGQLKEAGKMIKDAVKGIPGKLKGKSAKEIFKSGVTKFKALPGPAKAVAVIGSLLFVKTLFKKNKEA